MREINENNYLKNYPDILKLLDIDKNKEEYGSSFDAEKILIYSKKKYWFKCYSGHSFKKSIRSMVNREHKCPICDNTMLLSGYNDLETYIKNNLEYSYIKDLWDLEKNNIKMSDVKFNESKEYYFKCSLGHSFKYELSRAIMYKVKCPICSNKWVLPGFNDLQTRYSEIAQEWDYEKNYPVKPNEVMPGSQKKYYWKCKKCGESYLTSPHSRTDTKSACPYCAHQKILPGYNDLETYVKHHPEFQYILDEWDYSENAETPSDVFKCSTKLYHWVCPNGHKYTQRPANRISIHSGCPKCAVKRSAPELTFVELCKRYFDINTISGFYVNFREYDICIPSLNLLIEYDGVYWHSLEKAQNFEKSKNLLALDNSYILIRIKETDDLELLSKFSENILYEDGKFVKVYYISSSYNDKYFSEIKKILLNISENYFEKAYENIKNNLIETEIKEIYKNKKSIKSK